MNRGSRVRIDYHRGAETAACECGQIDRRATRERLRQHVAQTGHSGRYVVEKVTRLPPQAPNRRGDRAASRETTWEALEAEFAAEELGGGTAAAS